MTELKGFNLAKVEKRIDWTGDLFSLRVSGAPLTFKAGQFTKLALLDDEASLSAALTLWLMRQASNTSGSNSSLWQILKGNFLQGCKS